MNGESKTKPEVSEHSQTAMEYCCSCNSEEMDEYFPKFEPLPLLYFTEEQGSKSKK